MSSHREILYQIIFGTKHRQPVLIKENRAELFKYIWGIVKKNKCHLYRINGIEDHLHLVTDLHPDTCLGNLIKDIKVASAGYIKDKALFKNFTAWQEGYGAFTYHHDQKHMLIEYVKNQEEHHKTISFRDEYIQLLKEHGIDFDEKYLL